MSSRAILDPRASLRALPKALAAGLALGGLFWLLGLHDVRAAFVVPVVFSVVMWCGFELFGPWLSFVPDERRSPGAMALRESLRGIGLYTALLALAVVLSRVLGGVNVLASPAVAIITYLIGFAIMSLVGSFHTTGALADAARARAEHARKTQELEEARALQLSMLPGARPEVPGLDVAFGMRTATEVGGDYYDWRVGPDGALSLAVGDATGHGARAGLLVVAAKTLFQTGGGAGALDAELKRVSDAVRSLRLPRMNMALALAAVSSGRARIAAGGMPPVLHFRAREGTVAEILLEAPPAGQLARASYREETAELAPGDVLLFLTDGLPELRDEVGELFGYERVRAAFGAAAPRGAQASVDALFSAADAFRGARPPDDDVTLVAVGVA
jgi:hypothetical protein